MKRKCIFSGRSQRAVFRGAVLFCALTAAGRVGAIDDTIMAPAVRKPAPKPKSPPKAKPRPKAKKPRSVAPRPFRRPAPKPFQRSYPRATPVSVKIPPPQPAFRPTPMPTPRPTPAPTPVVLPLPIAPMPTATPRPTPRTGPPYTPSWIPRMRHNHVRGVRAVAYSHDGKWLATGSWRPSEKNGVPVGDVKLWDVQSGMALRTFTGHWAGVNALAFSPDDALLATASEDKSILLWSVKDGVLIGKPSGEAHAQPIVAMQISPDGSTLISADSAGTLKFWNLATRALDRTCNLAVTGAVRSVAFSWTANRIATGGANQKVRLWDLQNCEDRGVVVENLGYVTSLVFSPDGTRLASTNYQAVWLWDLTGKSAPRSLSANLGVVKALAFSSDGQMLASAGEGNNLALWHLESDERRSLSGQRGEVSALAFGPGAGELVSGDIDGNVLIWK